MGATDSGIIIVAMAAIRTARISDMDHIYGADSSSEASAGPLVMEATADRGRLLALLEPSVEEP